MSENKTYLKKNVYDMSLERIDFMLDNIESYYVSFSGGKDSSIMLQLIEERAIIKNKLPVNVLFIDLEAQYSLTIKHVEDLLINNSNFNVYWIALPFKLRNAVSIFEPHWICWDTDKINKWVRSMPKFDCVINQDNIPEEWEKWFYKGMEFEEFIIPFGMWFKRLNNNVLTFTSVGIRSDESLNRFLAVKKENMNTMYKEKNYTTMIRKDLFNFYPIYDYKTEDVWSLVGKRNYKYNKIYDFMYMAGKSIHLSRICQPFGDDQREGLDLFRHIEPKTWIKILDRVSGVNFGNIYAGNFLLGNRKVKKPGHFKTWKEYTNFLLNSIPKYQAYIYQERIKQFLKWWEEVENWNENDVCDEQPLKKDKRWLKDDGTFYKKIPSWERISKTILKNDINCKTIGFGGVVGGYPRYLKLKEMYGE